MLTAFVYLIWRKRKMDEIERIYLKKLARMKQLNDQEFDQLMDELIYKNTTMKS